MPTINIVNESNLEEPGIAAESFELQEMSGPQWVRGERYVVTVTESPLYTPLGAVNPSSSDRLAPGQPSEGANPEPVSDISAGGEGNYDIPPSPRPVPGTSAEDEHIYDTLPSNPWLVSGIFARSNAEGTSPPAQPSEVASPSDSGESASDQSDENWFSRHKLLTIGLCAGLIIVSGGLAGGLYFAFGRQPGSSSELGTTTQTSSSPSSIGTVTNTMEQSSTSSMRSSGSHSSTDILSTKTTTTDKMTSAIEQSSTSSTRSSKPHSSTGAMSTTTTDAPGSSTTSSLCTSIDDKYGMELEMLKRNAVAGKETRVGNFEFGNTGLATIKVEGLKTGDVVEAVSVKTGKLVGSKTAISGKPLEMDTFLNPGDTSIDVRIKPVSEGSSVAERNTVFTGTRGQGVVTCPLDLRVEPKPKSAQRQRRNAHAFHGRTSAARAAAGVAAAG